MGFLGTGPGSSPMRWQYCPFSVQTNCPPQGCGWQIKSNLFYNNTASPPLIVSASGTPGTQLPCPDDGLHLPPLSLNPSDNNITGVDPQINATTLIPTSAYSPVCGAGTYGSDIGAVACPAKPELLTDGGFESGAFGSGWTKAATNCDASCPGGDCDTFDTTIVHGGSKSAKMVSIGACRPIAIGDASIYTGFQQILGGLTVGRIYRFSGYIYSTSGTGNVLITQSPITASNTYCNTTWGSGFMGSPDTLCDIGTPALSVGWQYFSSVFQAENATTTLTLIFSNGASDTIYLDDLSVK